MPDPNSLSQQPSWLNRPLAIVGMACRLPGAEDLDSFWELLSSGGYAIERMPDAKLNRARYFDPQRGQRGKTYSDIGGFVAPRDWDWDILPIAASEAADWDECHLNLCEVTARACLHAGYDPRNLPLRKTGVYIGHSGGSTLGGELAYRTLVEDYVQILPELPEWSSVPDGPAIQQALLEQLRDGRPQRQAGKPHVDASYAAALISRAFSLNGPHMSIDAACASSLVALALAANALQAGQTDMAIVGGASYNKTDSLILFSHAQSCSATASRPFDENADGLISSEGYVSILVKTLDRATQDGDTIQAVIRGIGLSSDGRGRSLWAPRKEGQLEAIRRAYSGDVRPDSVHMVEAHATSTQVGDATEMEALAGFYGEQLTDGRRLPVGSVKSNIGHTLETAGLAGLVKSVLAIQNETIPPSANVQELSHSIPWSDIPLYVPTQVQPWPSLPPDTPRRAAVNAFGIGGLNVHLVVDQYIPASSETPPVHVESSPKRTIATTEELHAFEPIAVIGRGLVIPGSANLESYQQFLRHPTNHLTLPPAARARQRDHLLTACGFVTDFQYDWRTHKVPPKQIAQANPLQFMLLDAAEQALREAGLLDREFDRKRSAVVVGSPFGGDFGNSLFAGLRLPEFLERLQHSLAANAVPADTIKQLLSQFEQQFLTEQPALLDETGSFTSSTLASRLSKTFDLMGGAMAIDAGDCAGTAALSAACDLLHCGSVTSVLCAAAQRALDRAAIENLSQLGRLSNSGTTDGYDVGEGVALLVLKRECDALRDGDTVLATIHGIAGGFDSESLKESIRRAASWSNARPPSRLVGGLGLSAGDRDLLDGLKSNQSKEVPNELSIAPNVPWTGYLQASQSMLDVITTSLFPAGHTDLIASHTASGQSYLVQVSSGASAHLAPANGSAPKSQDLRNTSAAESERIFRFAANSRAELESQLTAIGAESNPTGVRFTEQDVWRAAVVCRLDELPSKLAMLRGQLGNARALVPLAEQGIFYHAADPSQRRQAKVAWLFPGQGSQYADMLRSWTESDPDAAHHMTVADQALAELRQPSFAQLAWGDNHLLGENVWHTQAAMLIADWMLMRALLDRGFRPQAAYGHSYGEFPAMLAAGCWDLPTALQATWHRCQSILAHVPVGCAMLSVQADQAATQQLIDAAHLPLHISHINAPEQTVVGGKQAAIAALAQQVDDAGISSRLLPVPTAFHTPALEPAVEPFLNALQAIDIQPSGLPLLSSVCNAYVADPPQMRLGLANQLTTRLDFVGAIKRLEADGISVAVEVGPQQVLSKLIRAGGSSIHVISTDHTRRGAELQLKFAQAALEVMTDSTMTNPATKQQPQVPVHFDATSVRRQRRRAKAQSEIRVASDAGQISTSKPAQHFDATDARRTARRLAAQSPSAPATPATHRDQAAQPSRVSGDADPAMAPMVSRSQASIETASATESASTTVAIEQFLIDFVVEQTGYPAEIIELDWDIEADLGIDSIKKAQLFGELREFFELEVHSNLSLDQFRSLRDIVDLLEQTPGKGQWLSTGTTADVATLAAAAENQNPSAEQAAQTAVNPTASDSDHIKQLTSFLIDFVVEQTGYPPEIVELDADLEADLGIDSIKKAQLLGELREMFDLQVPTTMPIEESGTAPTFATLRHILTALVEHADTAALGDGANPPAPVAEAGPEPNVIPAQNEQPQDREYSNSDAAQEPSVDASTGHLPQMVPDDSGRLVGDEKFAAAVQHHIDALASRHRTEDMRCLSKADNGHADWHHDRAQQIADSCRLEPRTVCAFDRVLHAQAQLTPCAMVDGATGPTTNASPVQWLVQLELPVWLANSHGTPLGQIPWEGTDQTALIVPGSVTPFIMVHRVRTLVAGSLMATESGTAHDVLTISRCLQSSPTVEELVNNARGLEVRHDWWLMAVDGETGQQLLIERRRGELVIEKSHLTNSITSSPTELASGTTARVGLDLRRGEFVVQSRRRPPPFSPEWQRLNSGSAAATLPAADADSESIASRYILRMAPAPLPDASGRQPIWSGTAVVVGDNPVARQLEARLSSAGVQAIRMVGDDHPTSLADRFRALAQKQVIPHLFITTPWDQDAAISLDRQHWQSRRNPGLLGNFWLAQAWLAHVTEHGIADDAHLVAVTTLGGDFGFSGSLHSAEGGGLAGLLKSMVIETWTQGIRPLPVKVLDCDINQSPAEVVGNIWQELAISNYDFEVSYRGGLRHVVRAIARPLTGDRQSIEAGGTWICTGGARGITAYVAEQLARRYDLKLHLLGTAPPPNFDPSWRDLDEAGLRALKAQVMTQAREQGGNPVKAWQNTEKALEIDATLRRLAGLGITAHYHSCDVADRQAVQAIVERARQLTGPIQGILHGAGVGKDSRFERKQADKVEQCIAAKVDGALSLMAATQADPLKYFVGFGSISGRFGANGHTDYSLANEMLCKQIDWFSRQRPEVTAVGFHWHAWGDVGMATKPETRLALEMIDMQFMPAAEGIEHLLAELECGAGEREVLITDDRYYRMFFPAETLVSGTSSTPADNQRTSKLAAPLLDREITPQGGGQRAFSVELDPTRDPFLTDHTLDGRPLLPFVVAAEILREAADQHLACSSLMLRDIEATNGLRFFHDGPQQVRVEVNTSAIDHVHCQLYSDFRARDGRLVDANRRHFHCVAAPANEDLTGNTKVEIPTAVDWSSVSYPTADSQFYVGWPLQRLRKFALLEGALVGKILAPALIELAGSDRDVSGWKIPSAALDACLFATGILAWQQVAAGSALPVRMGALSLGRLPFPGESLEVHVRLNTAEAGKASFDFSLYGVNHELILDCLDYQVAWLSSPTPAAVPAQQQSGSNTP